MDSTAVKKVDVNDNAAIEVKADGLMKEVEIKAITIVTGQGLIENETIKDGAENLSLSRSDRC